MNATFLLHFYRVTTWDAKIGWWRWIGYLALGIWMGGGFEPGLVLADTAAMFGLFMFVFSIDDYFDWHLEDDRNFLRAQVEAGVLSRRESLLLCALPLIPSALLLMLLPATARFLALGFLLLAGFHSMPPVRFKRNHAAAFLSSPVCAAIVFLQGVSVGGGLRPALAPAAVLLFAFHFYMDLLHETGYRVRDTGEAALPMLRRLKRYPAAPLAVSAALALHDPVFLISAVSWIVRAWALRGLTLTTDFRALRQGLFSPIWFLPEFAAYAALAMWAGV